MKKIIGLILATTMVLPLLPVGTLASSAPMPTTTGLCPPPYPSPIIRHIYTDRTSITSANVGYSSDNTGKCYYQVDGVAPEKSSSLINTEIPALVTEHGINFLTIKDITPEAHVVYLVVESYGAVSNLLVVDIPRAYIPPVYAITITNGAITAVDGVAKDNSLTAGSYAEWTQLQITADQVPGGYVFDKWTSNNGNDNDFADPTSHITTFLVPTEDIAITANWKQITASTTPTTALITKTADSNGERDSFIPMLWIGAPLLAASAVILILLRKKKGHSRPS